MEILKTVVKISKKILFAAECCIFSHILVIWTCFILSEILRSIVQTNRLLPPILMFSDLIVVTSFIIEVFVFINYSTYRVFGDIFEIDKKTLYYGIGFVSTASISVLLLHGTGQYYGTTLTELLNIIICVPVISLFYYAYAGMGEKRKGRVRQNENTIGPVNGLCDQDEALLRQNTKEDDRKKKEDLAVKVTGISLMAISFFELMMNLLSLTGILTEAPRSGGTDYYFPAMSMMLLVFTIAVIHWKYSGHVFLTPRLLGWIAYFLSFVVFGFCLLHMPTPLF